MAIDEGDLLNSRSSQFADRVATAGGYIRKALASSQRPYVALSMGKDSLAVLALVEMVDPNIPAVWSDDELEYPESVDLAERLLSVDSGQLHIITGYAEHAGWFRPWSTAKPFREPLPGTIQARLPAERWAKEQGYTLTFLGLRADESRERRDWLVGQGGIYRNRHGRMCSPIWDWSADDVWALIAGLGLPYNRAYDRLAEIGIHRSAQRVGPLPLSSRMILTEGWPGLMCRLDDRYPGRWA